MNFRCFTLVIDEEIPDIKKLASIQTREKHRISIDNHLYEYNITSLEERFFFIEISYNDFKYRDTVYDTTSETEKLNPRKNTEIELKHQIFACFDSEKNEFYLTDSRKKIAVKSFFTEIFGLNNNAVKIKERISSAEEFDERVKSIRKIKYTQTRTLFNMYPESLFSQQYNPLGLDLPDRAITTLEYKKNININDNSRNIFKSLFSKKKNREIESIEIVGTDDEKLEVLFTLDTIVKTIKIDIKEESDGLYKAEKVKEKLIFTLKEIKDVSKA